MFLLFWLIAKVKGLVAMLPGLRAFVSELGAVDVKSFEDVPGTRPAHPAPQRPASHSCVPLTATALDTSRVRGHSRSASGGEGRRSSGSGLGLSSTSGHDPARLRRVGVPSLRLTMDGVRLETAARA